MPPKLLILLLALSFSGTPAAYRTMATVTGVQHGIVTICDGKRDYHLPADEAWRVGDRAECIILTRGTASREDDEIAHVEYIWRK